MRSLLLAKANLRKSKGLSICISLLILISAMFICISTLLIYDYKQNASQEAKRLNTSDVEIFSSGDSDSINKEYIDSIIPDNIEKYYYKEHINIQTPITFNGGEVTPNVNIITKKDLYRNISKIEILEEDNSITDNYIYIPYHIHTGGGINIGDNYKIKFPSKTYEFKVKGYINSIYSGSYNMNKYEMIVSDEIYNEILANNPKCKAFSLFLNYKDKSNTDVTREANILTNKIYVDTGVNTFAYDLDITLSSRTFMSMIVFVSFLMIALIVIGIVMLMIFNNITNYIRENIKSIGVLKAMGYTTSEIKKSQLLQFGILTIIGLSLGLICGYLFMPVITNLLIAQSGIPYTTKFNLMATLLTILIIPLFVLFIVLISVRKIKKVNPIEALRDGIETHNFKKNHIPLSKTKLSLNTSLALKNMFKNLKQNIISFITVIFLSFLMIISMAMYQNFSRKPNLSLMTFELVDGVIEVDNSIKEEFRKDLENDSNITKYKYLTNVELQDKDYSRFNSYVLEDPNLINNKGNLYKGRYPKYDNEIVISGKYASDRGYKIGDKIEMKVGDNSFAYLITGFIQSTNNDGREVVILYDGIKRITDIDKVDSAYYFDSNVKASVIIDRYSKKYGDKVKATLNFEELIEGQMDTFINVANLMVVVTSIISGCIIVLVLYLLMKSLIFDRRYEYGILKANGYKSRDLIKQNVLSFMPTIIVGTLIGTAISYYMTNPYIGYMMRSFGIMKCNMIIPVDLIIITILFLIGTSLVGTILMSSKIKKIEPCELLKGE